MTRLTAQASALAAVLGVAVVAPWTQGEVLLLDWVSGPKGLIATGTVQPAMPLRILLDVLPAAAWLPVLAFFPLAGGGAAAMVGGSRWRRYAAALFMVCNPVVVDRVRVGHIAFLLGLAVLPWLVASLRKARAAGGFVRPAAWCAAAAAMSASTGWLALVVVLVVGLIPGPRWRDALRCGLVLLPAGLVALPAVVVGSPTTPDAYPTRGGLPAVLALQGFWRTDRADTVWAWFGVLGPVLLLALAVAVIGGFLRAWRVERGLALPALLLTAIGILLAPGGVLAEAQQWVGLVLLGYTTAFGFAAEWAATRLHTRVPVASAAIAATPLLVAPTLVWGAGIPASQYPLGWLGADLVMGQGQGSVLFLPWHAYQPFRFTSDRTVATTAAAVFRRPVLTNDAVELPVVRTASDSARTAYVTRLLADGGGGDFGQLVAPLGVEFVAVAQSTGYDWLAADPSLQPVLSTESMTVYRVRNQGTGRVQGRRVARYEDLVAGLDLGTEAVTATGTDAQPLPSDAAGGLRRTSPHAWQLEPGAPGWVVLPEEYDPGWQLNGRSGEQTVAGTIAFDAGPEAASVTFQPWRLRLAAQVLALLVLVAAVVAALVAYAREVAAQRRAHSAPASARRPPVRSEPAAR